MEGVTSGLTGEDGSRRAEHAACASGACVGCAARAVVSGRAAGLAPCVGIGASSSRELGERDEPRAPRASGGPRVLLSRMPPSGLAAAAGAVGGWGGWGAAHARRCVCVCCDAARFYKHAAVELNALQSFTLACVVVLVLVLAPGGNANAAHADSEAPRAGIRWMSCLRWEVTVTGMT